MHSSEMLFLFLILIPLADSCFVVRTKTPTVSSETCKCPPVFLYGQEELQQNVGARYLKNRQTWRATANFTRPNDPCWVEIDCPRVAGVTSYYRIMLRDDGNPIFLDRVVNNQSTFIVGSRSVGGVDCRLVADGTYQWHYHDYPLKNVGFTCQADMDNCKCPKVAVDTSGTSEVVDRYPDATEQCSLYGVLCPNRDEQTAFLYSENNIIAPGTTFDEYQKDHYEDLMCIKEDDGGFNWYFSNLRLEGNVSIGCDTFQDAFGGQKACSCGVFPKITTTEQLEKYDKNNTYKGSFIGNNNWEPGCGFRMSCDQGYTAVVFSENYKPLMPEDFIITCRYNPLTNGLRMWVVNSIRVINPAGACLKAGDTPTVSSETCKCPPVSLYGQEELQQNAGARYLKNRQTWRATANFTRPNDPCWVEIDCPRIAGVTSYYRIMLRDGGNPIFLDRVVNNQSTFIVGSRSVGGIDCRPVADGTYQWHYHDYPLKNVAFTCQADMDNCKCPKVAVDTSSTSEVVDRYPDATEQCSLYGVLCPNRDEQTAFLYSENNIIAPGTTFDEYQKDHYEDLMCIKEDDGGFNWYFSNLRLEGNVSIGCDTFQDAFGGQKTCACGVFPKITTTEQLKKYDKNNTYKGSLIGNNNWEPGCGFRMSCGEGYTAVVFSDNYKPLMPEDFIITCRYNPLTNGLRMWVVNSIRVINPAGACLNLKITLPTPPPPVELPNCNCPPIDFVNPYLYDGLNEDGRYLKNQFTWHPNITSSDKCSVGITCNPIYDYTSFYSVIYRSNGSPIYVNRVVDGVSTYYEQPRTVTYFECAKILDGTYQWHYCGAPVNDVKIACVADDKSCKCPEIKVDTARGVSVENRAQNDPTRCSFYKAKCATEGHIPMLYTKDTIIQSGTMSDSSFFEDLMCVEGDESTYSWYYNNLKIENITIGCDSVKNAFGLSPMCIRLTFDKITSREKLEKYDKTKMYDNATIGVITNSFNDCVFSLKCADGFMGIVFSDNQEPIEVLPNAFRNVLNLLRGDGETYVVGGKVVVNPAGACLKLN